MPVILRIKGFRFWFYEADLDEPAHLHVGRSGAEAKYWLDPVGLARNHHFRDHELSEIERILADHIGDLLIAWEKELRRRDND